MSKQSISLEKCNLLKKQILKILKLKVLFVCVCVLRERERKKADASPDPLSPNQCTIDIQICLRQGASIQKNRYDSEPRVLSKAN